jgi:hypothetical protein
MSTLTATDMVSVLDGKIAGPSVCASHMAQMRYMRLSQGSLWPILEQ